MMGLLVFWSTKMHAFTPQQRSRLLANRNVQDITEKNISFTPAFKLKAVKLNLEGMPANQIFQEAGIPLEYFITSYSRNTLKKWVRKFKEKGEDAFLGETRGTCSTGRPKIERFEELTYDELLALVEIQKGALQELKKQNALARKKKL
jgi:transposase